MKNDINLIIHKFIQGNATTEELSILKHWILEDENKIYFKNSVELEYLLDFKFKTFNVKNAMDKFNTFIEDTPPALPEKHKYLKPFLKYVAVFIGIVGITLFFQKESKSPEKLIIEEENITLQLNNGKTETISDFGDKKILNKHGKIIGQQEGSKLDYSNNAKSNTYKNDNILTYNELIVPYGKTFQLILSDGTQVYLNAGTTLKYPVQFIKGENRRVFLKGEAFFNVAKNVDNPFVINADSLNIKVLGTQFNVSSYVEDAGISVVLVEGAVGLYEKDEDANSENATFLKPNEKGTWNKIRKNISVEKVDTEIYTGWIGGKLIFKNIPFKNIRKKLERHYNVTIKNNDKILGENTYNAIFDIENIEEVLQTLNESYPIEYTIVNNQIQIN